MAVSGAGSAGLGQLMPGTARDLGITKRFDPQANVWGPPVTSGNSSTGSGWRIWRSLPTKLAQARSNVRVGCHATTRRRDTSGMC